MIKRCFGRSTALLVVLVGGVFAVSCATPLTPVTEEAVGYIELSAGPANKTQAEGFQVSISTQVTLAGDELAVEQDKNSTKLQATNTANAIVIKKGTKGRTEPSPTVGNILNVRFEATGPYVPFVLGENGKYYLDIDPETKQLIYGDSTYSVSWVTDKKGDPNELPYLLYARVDKNTKKSSPVKGVK
ncbi:hypothetical protein PilKf_01683 [Pillotina sp. SPG140]|jgi:hypothetical protein